jgi:molybdopterin-guanine dinucleotide biosynthesis adapter protein
LALVKPLIFQIVGYKNSGKTTITTELLKRLKADGLKVVSVKHHGHGGKPETAKNNDSTKHLESGAIASIVEGDGSLLLQSEKTMWKLEEKIKLAGFFQPDVILIEGHKNEPYPKLLLIRSKGDLELLQLRNIQVIVVWEEALKKSFKHFPCFYVNNPSAIDWTVDYLEKQL